jgi:hypothetical protein
VRGVLDRNAATENRPNATAGNRTFARASPRHEIRRDENWQPALGEIIVSTPNRRLPENFLPDNPSKFPASSRGPPPPLAEGLFDYRDYLQTRGIYYQLKTESTNDWQIARTTIFPPPLTDRFLNWSKQTLALGLPVEDEPLALLWAMTLGWRTAFTGDISDPFLRAGTMHLFAIDGLRIALISGCSSRCCACCKSRARGAAHRDSGHLVLHRRDRLGIVRHPRVGDDDHRPRRLGAETSRRHRSTRSPPPRSSFCCGNRASFLKPVFNFHFSSCSSSDCCCRR